MEEFKLDIEVVESIGDFSFVGDVVKFQGKVLDPAIGQGVFLMYKELKESKDKSEEAKKERNYYKRELTRQSEHTEKRRENFRDLLRKVENLETQNRALIEYAKVLKKEQIKNACS